jgi:hypothetical protein
MNYENIIWVIFTDPDLDRALTESENGKAKFICDKRGRLLGAYIIGDRAGKIIHSCQISKTFETPFKKLQSVIHAYPTYFEIIREVIKDAYISDWKNKIEFQISLNFFNSEFI